MQDISISTDGIKKNLKNYKPLDALCEYIWNGFDAGATTVSIQTEKNEFGLIEGISVCDNGQGISFEELSYKFKPFNESKKYDVAKKNNHTLPHGRQGIGRLTFFVFADKAIWKTVYNKDGQNLEYSIKIEKDHLNQFDDNGGDLPKVTQLPVGTEVSFVQTEGFSKEEIITKIKNEYFWFLEVNKENQYKITIDGEMITYEDYVEDRIPFISKLDLDYAFDIRIIQWKQSLGNEYSKFYYLGSDGKEIYKEATKLNKKADEFYHSVIIKSSYFDTFYFEKEDNGQGNLFPSRNDEVYKKIMTEINDFLLDYRSNYLREASQKYISRLVDSKIYPEFDMNNVIEVYKKKELDNLVTTLYSAEPKIFTGLSDDNKKITINLLNLIMDSGNRTGLFSVLKQVIELSDRELAELEDVLKYTTLSNVTKLVKLLEDRQKVIQSLKEIVFKEEFNSYEVKHVQAIVEKHYWIFGEQYNLITSAEPDFEQALMRLIEIQTGKSEKVSIDNPDKNKEMDIYMVRQNRQGDVVENVVVELKRPSVLLGEHELSQVKRYMNVIKKEDRFNSGKTKWTFYLVGNRFDTSSYIEGEIESHKSYGEPNLVHVVDDGKTKIYVLKWSEIFEDFSKNHSYLMEKLKLEEKLWLTEHADADDAVEDVLNNDATMPSYEIKSKK